MPKTSKLAQSEWIVMRILWANPGPMTAADIVAELSGKTAWHPRTIKTLLGRLVRKRALGFRKRGKAYQYYPRVSEAACLETEGAFFLTKCFDGALRPMLAHFVQNYRLTQADINEMKRLIERKEATTASETTKRG
ncbi:MAG: BlaI/MecI/CopY family transcriptional regulator [Acidobacteria bacterium]|nr:BlaI/MecI/CopY family transcriptional regulator [Acidobacteriota bacterium]